jgi:hypothetical protein
MNVIFKRRGKFEHRYTQRTSCEVTYTEVGQPNGLNTGKETEMMLTKDRSVNHCQKLDEAKNSFLEALDRVWPSDTLISDFLPQTFERTKPFVIWLPDL